jgi:hypothetical protein
MNALGGFRDETQAGRSRSQAPLASARTYRLQAHQVDVLDPCRQHHRPVRAPSPPDVRVGLSCAFRSSSLERHVPRPSTQRPYECGRLGTADRKYQLHFSRTHDSVVVCADELASYVAEAGLPWFERFASPEGALAPNGPLTEDSQARLRLALGGEPDAAAVAASRAMLGISS